MIYLTSVEEVSDLELEVGDAVKIVWCRVNVKLYCPWRLNWKSLEGICLMMVGVPLVW